MQATIAHMHMCYEENLTLRAQHEVLDVRTNGVPWTLYNHVEHISTHYTEREECYLVTSYNC